MTSITLSHKFLLARRLIILALAGLLIFLHVYTLFYIHFSADNTPHTLFDYVQSVMRIFIVISLTFVILGARWALIGMWISISGLVATQYWAHFGNLPVDFIEGRHPLSYLKGFIFPTIITFSFHSHDKSSDAN